MKKAQYLQAVMTLLKPDQILLSANNPTRYMTTMHIKLHFVALRRLGYSEVTA
jgi:hypothetical protein